MTTQKIHYGLIDAHIDDDAKVVTMRLAPRRRQPLPPATIARCLSWALDRVTPYRRKGYMIDFSDIGEKQA